MRVVREEEERLAVPGSEASRSALSFRGMARHDVHLAKEDESIFVRGESCEGKDRTCRVLAQESAVRKKVSLLPRTTK